jgi:hypothetical protein
MEYLGKRKDMVGQAKRHSRRAWLIFFLALWLWQQLTQTPMWSDPIVDRQHPPTGCEFCVRFTGKGQSFMRLYGTHQSAALLRCWIAEVLD